MRSFIVFVAIWAVVCAAPTETSDGLLASALKFVKECENKPMSLCFKERALHYVDQTQGNIELADGVTFIQTEQPAQGRSLNEINLPTDLEARENEIDSLLVDRVARFMGSYTLQFKIQKDSIQDMQRSLEESRGKKGKKLKKLLGPLLLLGKLKAAILLKVAIAVLALIAFKALIIGKLALLISGFLALKKLLDSKQTTQSYEVVAHPQEEHHHGHYDRSFEAQNLAYSGHA